MIADQQAPKVTLMTAPDLSTMSDEERFTLARTLTEDMRRSLPAELYAGNFTLHSKLPYKAGSFREILLHRQSDLASVAIELYETKRLVPAFIMTRAVLETTALLYGLHVKMNEFLEKKDEAKFDEFLMKGMFGSRDGTTSRKSFQILDAIDRMDKEFEGLRSMYDTLCEYTHPNYSGAMGSYSMLERGKHLLHLGREHHEPPLAFGLAPFIGGMTIFTYHYNVLAELLEKMNGMYQ